MGIALHPYLVGQPYRLRHLRRALAAHRARRATAAACGSPRRAPSAAHVDTLALSARGLHELRFPSTTHVGAWVPHGRFVIDGAASGPLAGLRFAAKDVFDVAGHPTGAGNPTWLATHAVPAAPAAVVATLLEAGATLMGKVLTDELAYSLHGDNHHYGTPINARAPRARDRRLVQRLGGGGGGRPGGLCAGHRHGRLDARAGQLLRPVGPAHHARPAVSADGLVPLHPGFDTVDLAGAGRRGVRARGRRAAARQRLRVRGALLCLDDALALADAEFGAPLQRLLQALAMHLDVEPTHLQAAPGEALSDWRQVYATAGAFEGWQTHGAWITRTPAGVRRRRGRALAMRPAR